MSCFPNPKLLCGNTTPDTCVTISDANLFKDCASYLKPYLPDPDGCYRQSDFNKFFATYICRIAGDVGRYPKCDDESQASGILGSIGLECLRPCDPDLGAPFKPVGTGNESSKVSDEFQNVYYALCDLKTILNNWTELPLPPGFDLGCIGDKCCGIPPQNLGQLLQALIAKICCATHNAVDANGVVLSDKISGACPDC